MVSFLASFPLRFSFHALQENSQFSARLPLRRWNWTEETWPCEGKRWPWFSLYYNNKAWKPPPIWGPSRLQPPPTGQPHTLQPLTAGPVSRIPPPPGCIHSLAALLPKGKLLSQHLPEKCLTSCRCPWSHYSLPLIKTGPHSAPEKDVMSRFSMGDKYWADWLQTHYLSV